MSPSRAYGWAVNVTLQIATGVLSTAQTAAATAISDINTALKTLGENSEINFVEISGVVQLFSEGGSAYSAQGQLLIGADASENAAQVFDDSRTAVTTAIAALTSPLVTVTYDVENGVPVLQEVG